MYTRKYTYIHRYRYMYTYIYITMIAYKVNMGGSCSWACVYVRVIQNQKKTYAGTIITNEVARGGSCSWV